MLDEQKNLRQPSFLQWNPVLLLETEAATAWPIHGTTDELDQTRVPEAQPPFVGHPLETLTDLPAPR